MKDKSNNIDDLFKRSFDGYRVEPSDHVWTQIAKKYFNSVWGGYSLLNFTNLISVIVLVGGAISIYFIIQGFRSTNIQDIPLKQQITLISDIALVENKTEIDYIPSTQKINNDITLQIEKTTNKDNSLNQNTLILNKINNQTENKVIQEDYQNRNTTNENYMLEQFNTYELNEDPTSASLASLKSNSISLMQPKSFEPPFLYSENIIRAENKNSPLPQPWNKNYRQTAQWSLGFYYMPEYVYDLNNSSNRYKNNSIDLLVSFEKNNFQIKGGLGITFTDDQGDFTATYERYDSTGFYYDISGFTIDPQNPGKPVFETYLKTVYDSVLHTTQINPNNSYTYISLPVMLGYKVFDYKRFSFSIMGGGAMSILMHRTEQIATFEEPDATFISMEDHTPKRITTNWRITISAGLNYQLSNKIGISFEPNYNHYIRPVYEKSQSEQKNPYSFGLRFGLTYTF
jgi:hypothetical protein